MYTSFIGVWLFTLSAVLQRNRGGKFKSMRGQEQLCPRNPRSDFGKREFGALGGLSLPLPPSRRPSGCMPRLAAHERDNPQVLDTAAFAFVPFSPFLCRFAGIRNARRPADRRRCRTPPRFGPTGACMDYRVAQKVGARLRERFSPVRPCRAGA